MPGSATLPMVFNHVKTNQNGLHSFRISAPALFPCLPTDDGLTIVVTVHGSPKNDDNTGLHKAVLA